MPPCDKALQRKLHRARRLQERGSTPGERQAAKAAVDRLSRRLQDRPSAPTPDAPRLDWLRTDLPCPDAELLHRKLDAWEAGDLSPRRLQSWARKVVDRQLMPDHPPTHPGSIAVELVMVLSALESHGLRCRHIPQLRAFLDCSEPLEGWQRWLAFLSRRARGEQVLADVV